ncbi:DNA-binding transcriptional regulator, MarR family [Paenibacillus sp. UNC496MF]|uniref:MarR family winged helix-turn-helix transcriptional regulator n=1 Tax=Paenibacillus sp. UNC496MF TaxID=1502753 RepID=UPI0008EFB0B2|nr:MarR family transcriptional regulator [Paenibacillus sp. UNC496MF]SFJ12912.1 DNA-binding transcriptional regulator, MarR family [Paenibacillus sp. UNC496MF]
MSEEWKNPNRLPIGFEMGVTHRKLAALFQHRLGPYGITPEQWSALNQIDRAQGLIQKEIAERTYKDKPTTTRILDHLERKGLIYKKQGEHDRRSYVVFSTDAGKALIRETTPLEDSVTADVMQCISEAEYETVMELLQRIQRHIGGKLDCGAEPETD